MKEKMKEMVKRIAVVALAVSVILGSVSAPMKVEAKGTAFINKKVSSVTPTVKSAKRSNGKVTVTVSVPASRVKKLVSVRNITVAYGSTKNSKKFEAKKCRIFGMFPDSSKNFTFVISNTKLASYRNAYITVRFDGKSDWSRLVKVSGKASSRNYKTPKKDKDGTYASAIHERFKWEYNGCKLHSCGATLGTWDDGDGWIYVTASASECVKCNETSYAFVMANADSDADGSTAHIGHGNKVGTIVQIVFDKKTGKVVDATPCVLERYPVGTFFMDVE